MPAVDLNADLGEGEELAAAELSVLGAVTSASISCGVHAGSPAAIRDSVAAAARAGVVIGAHPSYPDRAGAGRRHMDLSPRALAESLAEQVASLGALARAAGATLRYVKPHGALYNRLFADAALADVVAEVVRASGDLVLLLQAGSAALEAAAAAGVQCAAEAFADRAYLPDGRLVPRHKPGAVLGDERAVVAQALSIVVDGGVQAIDGTWVSISAASVCLHGDTPGAAELTVAVRRALEGAGVDVRPFA